MHNCTYIIVCQGGEERGCGVLGMSRSSHTKHTNANTPTRVISTQEMFTFSTFDTAQLAVDISFSFLPLSGISTVSSSQWTASLSRTST